MKRLGLVSGLGPGPRVALARCKKHGHGSFRKSETPSIESYVEGPKYP